MEEKKMDDEFLTRFRKEPRAEFARALYQKIDQPVAPGAVRERPGWTRWRLWRPALAGAAAFIVIASVFVVPDVRAAAQEFLNLFRVRRFVAVSVDPARFEQLENSQVDLRALIGASTEVIEKPGEPQLAGSAEEAGQLAGITVRTPSVLPQGYSLLGIKVQPQGTLRFTADTTKIQTIIDAIGASDVAIPPQLNGASVTVTKPPVVVMTYARGRDNVALVQARSPDVALPDGVNLRELGEIGLRVAGLPADEARQFAQSVDWNSTLVIPIPLNTSSFQQADVRGTTGLLIHTEESGKWFTRARQTAEQAAEQMAETEGIPGVDPARPAWVLLWSEGDMVYALAGHVDRVDLMNMANSLN
jgi:hypothetical protein